MEKTNAGLYRGINVSVRILDRVIVIGIVLICVLIILFSVFGGFVVKFDSGDAQPVESQRLRYGSRVMVPDEPVRQGYTFEGWHVKGTDKKWDFEADEVKGSFVLTAKWKKD